MPCLSASFRPMFPHAASYNLRLITITVQGYPGSSPVTDAQMSALTSTDVEAASAALLDLSEEIASAIARIIKNEKLLAPSDVGGKRTGGVSIMAWSAGNAFLLSILGNIAALDKEVSATLERHLTSCILYGEAIFCTKPRKPVLTVLCFRCSVLETRDTHTT